MKTKIFRKKSDAQAAAEEVMEHTEHPAGVYGSARNWRVEAHGYSTGGSWQRVRILYTLGEDGHLHEISRREVQTAVFIDGMDGDVMPAQLAPKAVERALRTGAGRIEIRDFPSL